MAVATIASSFCRKETTTTTKPLVPSIWGRLHEPKENYTRSGIWISFLHSFLSSNVPSLRPLAFISCRITSIHVFFGLSCALLTYPKLICSTCQTGASVGVRRTWPNLRRPHSWFLWRKEKKRRWFLSPGKFVLHSKNVRQYLISCQSRFCNKRIRHHLFAEKPSLRVIRHVVTPRFPEYAETESRRESATYIREKNTPRIHAKPKLTWTSYKSKP